MSAPPGEGPDPLDEPLEEHRGVHLGIQALAGAGQGLAVAFARLCLLASLDNQPLSTSLMALAGVKVSPDGRVVSQAEWNEKVNEWLPSEADRAFVGSLMGRVVEPGKFANWIAPPVMGINRQPVDFEYIRFA